MSLYDPLHRDFWSPGSKARGRSAIAKLVYVYAFSNPRCSAAGIYPFDIADCVRSIGPTIDTIHDVWPDDVHAALIELEAEPPLIRFDPATGVIWVIGKWKRSMIKSANHKRRIGTEFLMSSAYPFWIDFFERNQDVFNFLNRPKSYKKQAEFKCCFETLARSVAGNPSGREGKERKSQDFLSLPHPDTNGNRDAPKGAAAPEYKGKSDPPAGSDADPSPAEAKRIVRGVIVDQQMTTIAKQSIDDAHPGFVGDTMDPPTNESERRRLLAEQLAKISKKEHDEKPDIVDP